MSIPEWATGTTFDGEDLTAYLRSQQPLDTGQTFEAARRERLRCIAVLEPAVADGPAVGLVRYELASLYELQGRQLDAIRLHALNRHHFGTKFHDGRYRLAVALSMLASNSNTQFAGVWKTGDKPTEQVRKDIVRYLEEAELYQPREKPGVTEDCFINPRTEQDISQVRGALLTIARKELRDYRHFFHWWRLMCASLRHRRWRKTLRPFLSPTRGAWDTRAGRRNRARVALEIVEGRLAGTQHPPRPKRLSKKPKKVSWSADYNHVCGEAAKTKTVKAQREICDELRRLVADERCELRRPSEWLAVDPDLQCMQHKDPPFPFRDFIEEQLRRDFAPPTEPATATTGDSLDHSLDQWRVDRASTAWQSPGPAQPRPSPWRNAIASLRRPCRRQR